MHLLDRCPDCNTRMRIEFESDPDQHVITDKYWLCPECGYSESYIDETAAPNQLTNDDIQTQNANSRCVQCGFQIHPSETICGECACEEDGL